MIILTYIFIGILSAFVVYQLIGLIINLVRLIKHKKKKGGDKD